MIRDYLLRFRTSGGSDSLTTTTTTAVLSDYLDTKAAGYFDGGERMGVAFNIAAVSTAMAQPVPMVVYHCATSGGTYVERYRLTLTAAEAVVGKTYFLPLGEGMLEFVKVGVSPGTTTNGGTAETGGLTVTADLIELN